MTTSKHICKYHSLLAGSDGVGEALDIGSLAGCTVSVAPAAAGEGDGDGDGAAAVVDNDTCSGVCAGAVVSWADGGRLGTVVALVDANAVGCCCCGAALMVTAIGVGVGVSVAAGACNGAGAGAGATDCWSCG